MATYYWVGGNGTWDASTTTNWATSSGGTGGAGVPTSADNVIIDTSSSTGIITCTAAVCNNLTITATQAIKLGAVGSTLAIYGSFTTPSSGSYSSNSGLTITFAATSTGKTIFAYGSFSSIFNGVGGGWTWTSAGTNTGTITLTNGSLDLSSILVISVLGFTYSATGTASLTLGSSIVVIQGINKSWNFSNTTGLTFSGASGTIQFFIAGASNTFNGGGLTYGSLITQNLSGNATLNITGANTFTGTVSSPNTTAYTITLPASTTTTVGNWIASGNSGQLLTLNSSISGTQATLTKSGGGIVNGINYLSVKDINGTPANTWFVGSNSTNVSNNTGIFFVNGFAGSVTESTTLSDSTNTAASFVSAITEPILAEIDIGSLIATFSAAITEPILAEIDIGSLIATFSSAITETLAYADLDTAIRIQISNILESLSLADAKLVQAAFNGVSIENITVQEVFSVISTYNKSQVENIGLGDAPIGFAWVKIDNTESTQWVLIDNRQ